MMTASGQGERRVENDEAKNEGKRERRMSM